MIDDCDKLNVPVLIDCAYYSICKDLNFFLDRPCISGIAFSMSKAFYGAERLRIGMRCKRVYNDDPADFCTGMGIVSKIAAGVGLELCNNFDPDYNHNKYINKQLKICEELNIEATDCVIFGVTNHRHEMFGGNDRGSRWRRVCISSLLGDMGEMYV